MSSSSSSSPSSAAAAQGSHYPHRKVNHQQIPLGLGKLIDECDHIYPNQPNPLQITTILKYWLGGQDPIDYISMYYNRGNIDLNIPPHWHYISMGLSDLHGDGRVHRPAMSSAKTTPVEEPAVRDGQTIDEPRSGMGFELTFRLIVKNDEDNDDLDEGDDAEENDIDWRRHRNPPTWPANLLQALARYVFQTGNRLCAGDHIPWHKTLDNLNKSQIKHMLIANDPRMQRIETAFGWVDFCQIVGVTDEELNQAARWNGNGVLDLLRKDIITGGDWLITDMDRCESVFELFPETLEYLEDDLENDGSDLAGISAQFIFNELIKTSVKSEIDSETLNLQYIHDNKILTLKLENGEKSSETVRTEKEMVTTTKPQLQSSSSSSSAVANAIVVDASADVHQRALKIDDRKFLMTLSVNNSLNNSCPLDYQSNSTQVISLEGLHLTLPPYAAKFLLLAIKDRVRHGRHFTFKGKRLAITFVAESVDCIIVTRENPYAVIGYWVQVLITEELLPKMLESLQCLSDINVELEPDAVGGNATEWPREFKWPEHNLKIVIDNLRYDSNDICGVPNY